MNLRLLPSWLAAGLSAALCAPAPLPAQSIVIPGTGQRVEEVGDDFEDPEWKIDLVLPKSSSNIDNDQRLPAAMSANQRLYESTYRGVPDVVVRIPTPPGGLPGSTGALKLRTLHSGIPGRFSREIQQDDLLMNISHRMGGYIPAAWRPSFVVRVCMPPFDRWEKRSGSSFGVRADCEGTKWNDSVGRRLLVSRRLQPQTESFWPGMFIQFNRQADGHEKDHAVILIRCDEKGRDIVGPKIERPGWWTLGMSVSADGRVHYFASPGVNNLTIRDHIGSYTPYNMPVERLNTFFFNVVNMDDGRTWSTEWVIDDPMFYVIK